MEFREQVLNLLAEVAENDIVKKSRRRNFEEGIIDSFPNSWIIIRDSK